MWLRASLVTMAVSASSASSDSCAAARKALHASSVGTNSVAVRLLSINIASSPAAEKTWREVFSSGATFSHVAALRPGPTCEYGSGAGGDAVAAATDAFAGRAADVALGVPAPVVLPASDAGGGADAVGGDDAVSDVFVAAAGLAAGLVTLVLLLTSDAGGGT